MGVSPFFVRMGVRTDRTPWKGMLSGLRLRRGLASRVCVRVTGRRWASALRWMPGSGGMGLYMSD